VKTRSTILAGSCLIGLTILSGILYGRLTGRFGSRLAARAAFERLQQVPERFGDWDADTSSEMSEAALQMLQCKDYLARCYVNRRTGERVDVSVILGPSGPVSEHTPEICISSRAYELLGPRRKVTIASAGAGAADGRNDKMPDELWLVDFGRKKPPPGTLRVYYGWSTGRRWTAPPPGFAWDWKACRFRGARAVFSGRPYLYKIQAATTLLDVPETEPLGPGDDPVFRFLQDFLPVLRSYLIHPDQAEPNDLSGSIDSSSEGASCRA